MRQFVLRRLRLFAALAAAAAPDLIFLFVRQVTGDPAALLVEPGASDDDIAAIHRQFGLDKPLWVQYRPVHGEPVPRRFSQLLRRISNCSVFNLYLDRLPNSLLLAAVAMAGFPAAGLRHPDRHSRGGAGRSFLGQRGQDICTSGLSLPSFFFVGLVLILVFSVYLWLAALVSVWRRVAHPNASLRPWAGTSPRRICA